MQHVVATAGHVDHGKSTLVRALTGIEPDRLAEEQRRGLTIDLGFAWTDLPSGETVAFVDVPGHERFVTNMLAGVGPAPAVLFVVAADAGWSAQSSEHLAILDALGVQHGVLALTRSDLGDADLAEQEARDYLRGTSLEGIAAVSVSAVTGAGLSELADALDRVVAQLPQPATDRTRLWVDRVFTVRGAGTVVTGTLASGSVAVDESLAIDATAELVRVRSIEALKASVQHTGAVARVALNLRGVKADAITRGAALTGPGQWLSVSTIDVGLSPARTPAETMTFHIGSAAIRAHVRPLGEGTARVTLARPIPAIIGERGLLRDPGSRAILAATVLDPLPPPLRRRGAAARRGAELAGRATHAGVSAEVRTRGAVRRDDLALIGVPLASPAAWPGVVEAAGWLIDEVIWQRWAEALGASVDAWAQAHPRHPGMSRQGLAEDLAIPDAGLIDVLVAERDDVISDASGVHRPGAEVQLPIELEQALGELVGRLEARPFDAADAHELAAAGLTDQILAVAVADGRLIRIADGVYLRPAALADAVARLKELAGPFTVAQAREALSTSRRVAVPLLEHLDRRRFTRRVDRQLREVVRAPGA